MARRANSSSPRRFVGLLDRPSRTLIEVHPGRSRRQATGRVQQEANAQPFLKLRERFGNRGLTDALKGAPQSKGAGVDYLNEGRRRAQYSSGRYSFHLLSLGNIQL